MRENFNSRDRPERPPLEAGAQGASGDARLSTGYARILDLKFLSRPLRQAITGPMAIYRLLCPEPGRILQGRVLNL